MKRVFYGWIIVAASALLLAISLGMFFSTNSLFVIPVTAELGFARGEFTLYRTIITLVGAISMPLYGKLAKQFGVKKLMVIGALMLSATTFAYSFSTRLWHFYVIGAVNGLFFNGIGFMTVGILINAWFKGRTGVASGIAFAGSGLGGAIMVPAIGRVIALTDWQTAFRVMGVIGIVYLIPITLLFIKNTPADMGHESLEDNNDPMSLKLRSAADLTLKEAAKTAPFYLLLITFFFINIFAAAANTHVAPYISDLGYSDTFVSAVVAVFMIFLSIGKIILGITYDRFGSLVGNVIVCIFCLGFPVLALLSHLPVIPWLFAMFIGMASCATSVSKAILVVRFFGPADFASIFGIYTMFASLAASISVPGMGIIFDVTGSYRPAWTILIFTSILITVCLLAAESVLIHNRLGKKSQPAKW